MSYSKNKNNSKNNHRNVIFLVIVLLAILITLFLFEKTGVVNIFGNSSSSQNIVNEDDPQINLNPPTEEELQSVEDNKQRLSEEMDKNQNPVIIPDGEKISIKPAFGYIEIQDGEIRANGFITTMIEEGGICTLTLRRNTSTRQTTSTSLADAQSTICGLMQIASEGMEKGEWIATLNYSSDKYEGVSDTQTIRIE